MWEGEAAAAIIRRQIPLAPGKCGRRGGLVQAESGAREDGPDSDGALEPNPPPGKSCALGRLSVVPLLQSNGAVLPPISSIIIVPLEMLDSS